MELRIVAAFMENNLLFMTEHLPWVCAVQNGSL